VSAAPPPRRLGDLGRVLVMARLAACCAAPMALMLLYAYASEDGTTAATWLRVVEPLLALTGTLFLSAWAWRHDRARLDDDRLARLIDRRRPPT
jgi:ABC-type sulfate transport system permease component